MRTVKIHWPSNTTLDVGHLLYQLPFLRGETECLSLSFCCSLFLGNTILWVKRRETTTVFSQKAHKDKLRAWPKPQYHKAALISIRIQPGWLSSSASDRPLQNKTTWGEELQPLGSLVFCWNNRPPMVGLVESGKRGRREGGGEKVKAEPELLPWSHLVEAASHVSPAGTVQKKHRQVKMLKLFLLLGVTQVRHLFQQSSAS